MNKRLLTQKQIDKIADDEGFEPDYHDYDVAEKAICKAQDAQTREMTLKEVGKLLFNKSVGDVNEIVGNLLRGKLPDGD